MMPRRRLLLRAAAVAATVALTAACSGFPGVDLFGGNTPSAPAPPPAQPATVGAGQMKVGLILPLTASGNAGLAAQSMKNAAEMALAELRNLTIQVLIKDEPRTAQGVQQAVQDAINEGVAGIHGSI